MRILFFLCSCAVFWASSCTKRNMNGMATNQQITVNQVVTDQEGHKKLLGKVNRIGFSQTPFNEWYETGLAYQPDKKTIKNLKKSLKEYDILAFFGTWCGDSRREMPHFFAILDEIKFDYNNLNIIAVDNADGRHKQSPDHEEEGLNIHRVPTFIFYKKGKEKGRIVESPINRLEDDILAITSENGYKNRYWVVSELYELLQQTNGHYIKQNKKELAKKYVKKTEDKYELNTFANMYLRNDNRVEGLSLLTLNAEIYPNDEYVLEKLVNGLSKYKMYHEAIDAIECFLEHNPNNEAANSLQNRVSYFIENQ